MTLNKKICTAVCQAFNEVVGKEIAFLHNPVSPSIELMHKQGAIVIFLGSEGGYTLKYESENHATLLKIYEIHKSFNFLSVVNKIIGYDLVESFDVKLQNSSRTNDSTLYVFSCYMTQKVNKE